jgi:hypothetical protein
MTPAGQILYEVLKTNLIYFNGHMWLEYRPGSLQDLAKYVEFLDNLPEGTQIQIKREGA